MKIEIKLIMLVIILACVGVLMQKCTDNKLLAQEVVYIGSVKSNKYHYQSCKWALKISPYNAVYFKSPEEAMQRGYVPCSVCKPPLAKFKGKDI